MPDYVADRARFPNIKDECSTKEEIIDFFNTYSLVVLQQLSYIELDQLKKGGDTIIYKKKEIYRDYLNQRSLLNVKVDEALVQLTVK